MTARFVATRKARHRDRLASCLIFWRASHDRDHHHPVNVQRETILKSCDSFRADARATRLFRARR